MMLQKIRLLSVISYLTSLLITETLCVCEGMTKQCEVQRKKCYAAVCLDDEGRRHFEVGCHCMFSHDEEVSS